MWVVVFVCWSLVCLSAAEDACSPCVIPAARWSKNNRNRRCIGSGGLLSFATLTGEIRSHRCLGHPRRPSPPGHPRTRTRQTRRHHQREHMHTHTHTHTHMHSRPSMRVGNKYGELEVRCGFVHFAGVHGADINLTFSVPAVFFAAGLGEPLESREIAAVSSSDSCHFVLSLRVNGPLLEAPRPALAPLPALPPLPALAPLPVLLTVGLSVAVAVLGLGAAPSRPDGSTAGSAGSASPTWIQSCFCSCLLMR